MKEFDVNVYSESIKKLSELYLKIKAGKSLTDTERVDYSNLIDSLQRYLPLTAWN